MEFHSEYIELFDRYQLRYYGIIIVAALLVATAVAARLTRREGKDPDHVWGALTWAIIPGIVGARLWFVLFPPAALTASCGIENGNVGTLCQDTLYMLRNFFNTETGAIAIWSGGLGIFGAVIGGFFGIWLYMRRSLPFERLFGQRVGRALNRFLYGQQPQEPFPLGEWLDIAAIVLPLGQAIGRWANYINQELFGHLTNLPWGISISVDRWPSDLNVPLEQGGTPRFHPLFLYESLWNLGAFFVLRYLFTRDEWRARFQTGDFFLLYICQYSGIRFLLEFLRLEIAYIPGTTVNSSQTITAIGFLGAGAVLLWRQYQRNRVITPVAG